jgi:diguanylate cyclase (GGDEF)-like protein
VVREASQPDQIFGRVGGEEFAVLWEGMNLDAAAKHAEQIRACVADHSFCVERTVLPVTVSLGVAERSSGSDEAAEGLYERADARLYAAKAGGRNRVCI